MDIPYSFSYIEGESLLRSYGGRMDYYYDRIYRMEDGEFILIGSGEYGNLGGGSITYGSDGEPVYDYEWEGTEVSSEEEYLEQLNEVYDTQQETTPLDGTSYDSASGRYVGGNICYYDEIIEAIRQY